MAYSPATNTTGTSTLGHLATVWYRKKALDRLQKKFVFRGACMDDMLPKQVGRTVQFFRYTNLGTMTTQTTEGTVGTGVAITSKVVTLTVSQYSNFITVSDLLQDTALDPILQNAAELLGYQGGLSVDTIVRTVIDNESGGTNVKQNVLSTSGFVRVADLRNARHSLQANDVLPFEDGRFLAILHPYVTFDLVNDPAAAGLADIFKYTQPTSTALTSYEDRGQIRGDVAGCKVIESTNVKTTSGSPNRYNGYIFGKNGVGCVDLEGRGPARVTDPTKQRFNINVIKGAPSIADPEGVIGGAVSYNYVFGTAILEGPTGIGGVYRFRLLADQNGNVGTASTIG